MIEIAIQEQMNGMGQDRMGWEMRLAEWDWFWKSQWHIICEWQTITGDIFITVMNNIYKSLPVISVTTL